MNWQRMAKSLQRYQAENYGNPDSTNPGAATSRSVCQGIPSKRSHLDPRALLTWRFPRRAVPRSYLFGSISNLHGNCQQCQEHEKQDPCDLGHPTITDWRMWALGNAMLTYP